MVRILSHVWQCEDTQNFERNIPNQSTPSCCGILLREPARIARFFSSPMSQVNIGLLAQVQARVVFNRVILGRREMVIASYCICAGCLNQLLWRMWGGFVGWFCMVLLLIYFAFSTKLALPFLCSKSKPDSGHGKDWASMESEALNTKGDDETVNSGCLHHLDLHPEWLRMTLILEKMTEHWSFHVISNFFVLEWSKLIVWIGMVFHSFSMFFTCLRFINVYCFSKRTAITGCKGLISNGSLGLYRPYHKPPIRRLDALGAAH